ncbi:carboxylic ester hydrolase-like [Diabrotica undecimpunctata]|uniref:carboxylic ester hydrolase-like n=1 Tax=Diabrotica undecimpunctata TaxID=50387 RepID=UPI003B640A23
MKLKVNFFCVLSLYLFGKVLNQDNSENLKKTYTKLKIEDGYVKGTQGTTRGKGTPYYAFLGIPYAKPPLGDLRFEAPQKNEKWEGVWDATKDGSECVQRLLPIQGSEDCLYINVYTPDLTLNGNLTVMVWIHGGAFIHGNSSYDQYGPDPILDYDVVFVSFNYRLGVFGFLSTEDMAAPGNAALKDQNLALKWVQSNIKHFGGDPKKVTLFGESAGAASVSYQLQSKKSKGLFRAAIMQSGNSLCLWSLNRNARKIAKETALALGFNTRNTTEMVANLKKVNYTDLHRVSLITSVTITLGNPLAGIMFSPVIEPYHKDAFFYNYSDVLLRKGEYNRVPVIIGVNSKEAAVADGIPALINLYFAKYDFDYTLLAPVDINKNKVRRDSAAFAIKYHYFGITPLAVQEAQLIEFISDDQFNRPTRRTVLDMAKYSPVYFYVFSYKGLLGDGANGTFKGVGHGEDLGFFFNSPNDPGTKSDELVRSRLITMWTNFAKYGEPTPKKDGLLQNVIWQKSTSNIKKLPYLDISNKLEVKYNPFEANMAFYDKVYRLQGAPPHDTY